MAFPGWWLRWSDGWSHLGKAGVTHLSSLESPCPAGLLMRTLPINLSTVSRDGGAWRAQAAAALQVGLGAGSREVGGGGHPPPHHHPVVQSPERQTGQDKAVETNLPLKPNSRLTSPAPIRDLKGSLGNRSAGSTAPLRPLRRDEESSSLRRCSPAPSPFLPTSLPAQVVLQRCKPPVSTAITHAPTPPCTASPSSATSLPWSLATSSDELPSLQTSTAVLNLVPKTYITHELPATLGAPNTAPK